MSAAGLTTSGKDFKEMLEKTGYNMNTLAPGSEKLDILLLIFDQLEHRLVNKGVTNLTLPELVKFLEKEGMVVEGGAREALVKLQELRFRERARLGQYVGPKEEKVFCDALALIPDSEISDIFKISKRREKKASVEPPAKKQRTVADDITAAPTDSIATTPGTAGDAEAEARAADDVSVGAANDDVAAGADATPCAAWVAGAVGAVDADPAAGGATAGGLGGAPDDSPSTVTEDSKDNHPAARIDRPEAAENEGSNSTAESVEPPAKKQRTVVDDTTAAPTDSIATTSCTAGDAEVAARAADDVAAVADATTCAARVAGPVGVGLSGATQVANLYLCAIDIMVAHALVAASRA